MTVLVGYPLPSEMPIQLGISGGTQCTSGHLDFALATEYSACNSYAFLTRHGSPPLGRAWPKCGRSTAHRCGWIKPNDGGAFGTVLCGLRFGLLS